MAPKIFTNKAGHALQGYDPVAYFTVGVPTKGDPSFTSEWQGATWLFSNQANREQFLADPQKYAPAFGGHCAVAQVMGANLPGSPKRWRIEDGQLFINKNLVAAAAFGPLSGRIRKLADKDAPSRSADQ